MVCPVFSFAPCSLPQNVILYAGPISPPAAIERGRREKEGRVCGQLEGTRALEIAGHSSPLNLALASFSKSTRPQ